MDVIAFVGLVAVLAIWLISFKPTDEKIRGFGRVLGFKRTDDWPRGVQEEDFDRPWGR
jgi:hypothetical protein